MNGAGDLQEVLTWAVERIRRDEEALTLLVSAALGAPGPERTAAIARLVQVVARKVPRQASRKLSTQLVELLDCPDADARYIGARLLLTSVAVPAALPGLRRGLGDEDAQVREACVAALRRAQLGPEALLPHLRSEREWEREAALRLLEFQLPESLRPEVGRMLADPEVSVRHRAAVLLAGDREVPGLWEVILDAAQAARPAALRQAAIQGLRALGLREEAVPVLLHALRTAQEAPVRRTVAEVLEELAPERPEVAKALVEALRDPDREVAMWAAQSLERRGATTAGVIPRLLTALEDTGLKDAVRGRVALTLAELGERAVVPVLVRLLELPDEAFEQGLNEVTGLPSPAPLKLDAVRALERLGPLAEEAVPVLLQYVRTGRDSLQEEAAEVVERLGTARAALEAVLCEVLPGAEGWHRERLREVLLRLKPEGDAALRELVKALEDEEQKVRDPVSHVWRLVGERPEFIERIAALTRDEDARVRSAAGEALRVLGRPTAESLERLARRLESETLLERSAAAGEMRVLGEGAKALLPEFLRKLPHLNPEARAAVLSVLGPVSGGRLNPALREALVAGLEDGKALVREATVGALCDFTEVDTDLVRRVEALRTDPELIVREAVEATLRALGVRRAEQAPRFAPGTPDEAAHVLREFAFSLYTVLREGEGNRVFSPLSIFTLLGLVLRGTRGHTEEALQRALHWSSAPSQLPAALRGLMGRLPSPPPPESGPPLEDGNEGFALVSANGFWPQEGYPLREEYLAELAEAFGITPTAVDFARAPEAASEVINSWAREHTQGRIPVIVPPKGLPETTRYVMANAVYFRARWAQPFYDDTRPELFHLLDGRPVEVPTMSREGCFATAAGAEYQLIELPYRGGHASMVLVVPEAGFFGRVERMMSPELVERLLAKARKQVFDYTLKLPRFHLDQRVDLTGLAERLGLSALVGPDADLSGMTPAREASAGSLLHEATLTVDEKGTEAAAVTRVFHIGGTLRVREVNRPFLFLLRHEETGAVLFLGRVLDPRSPSPH